MGYFHRRSGFDGLIKMEGSGIMVILLGLIIIIISAYFYYWAHQLSMGRTYTLAGLCFFLASLIVYVICITVVTHKIANGYGHPYVATTIIAFIYISEGMDLHMVHTASRKSKGLVRIVPYFMPGLLFLYTLRCSYARLKLAGILENSAMDIIVNEWARPILINMIAAVVAGMILGRIGKE